MVDDSEATSSAIWCRAKTRTSVGNHGEVARDKARWGVRSVCGARSALSYSLKALSP